MIGVGVSPHTKWAITFYSAERVLYENYFLVEIKVHGEKLF